MRHRRDRFKLNVQAVLLCDSKSDSMGLFESKLFPTTFLLFSTYLTTYIRFRILNMNDYCD